MVRNVRHVFCYPREFVAAGLLHFRSVPARNLPISVNESTCVPPPPVVYPYYADFVLIEVNFNDGKF